MDQNIAAAEAALKAGRGADAIAPLMAAIEADPARTAIIYQTLVFQLYRAGRYAEGEAWAARGIDRFPKDFDLLNSRAVMLRQLKRHREALDLLDRAAKLNPRHVAPLVNRGNILLDINEAKPAEAIFAKLSRQDPRNAEYQRQLGRSLLKQGKRDQGMVRLRQAVALKRDFIDAWLDMIGTLVEQHQSEEAEALADTALQANPDHPRIAEAKIIVIRRAGKLRRAEAVLLDLLSRQPDAAWIHYQLGTVISDWDRDRGNVHMRRAVELEPAKLEYVMALIESLERTRSGDEGANIEESYQISRSVLPRAAEFTPSGTKIVSEVLTRVCAFEEIDQLGDFATRGRSWATTNKHTALLKQLARIESDADRYELLEQHRTWGRDVEGKAARMPIRQPARRPPGSKIRLGFMSSDLRRHPVGYFALPLFDHLDRERFEVFIYSYYQGSQDQLQAYFTERVTAYRWWPDISTRDAAQAIADDDLDLLIELGGSTHMNKLDVMAWRPAPRQASWLGYPHSAGLSTIDYLIVDPYLKPERDDLLIERPMIMPSSWIALGKLAFPETHVIDPQPPVARTGRITFGTANNSYKYTPACLNAWARVVAATPGSRFLFVRPEGSCPTFQANIRRHFAAEGVEPERVDFVPVRGAHMQHYNQIDVALDTFPQTGGTTTCEALWMGVPTVSLVGPTLFERLSYSILVNTGLADLCVHDVEAYIAKAVDLAADRPRITALRTGLRETLKASPLGRTEDFARDFYDLVVRTVAESP